MDAELLELCNQTCTLAARTGHDGRAPSYGSTTEYTARIELDTYLTKDLSGVDAMARGKIYIDMQTIPLHSDKLTLPAGYEPLVPRILSITPHYLNTAEVDHVRIVFG